MCGAGFQGKPSWQQTLPLRESTGFQQNIWECSDFRSGGQLHFCNEMLSWISQGCCCIDAEREDVTSLLQWWWLCWLESRGEQLLVAVTTWELAGSSRSYLRGMLDHRQVSCQKPGEGRMPRGQEAAPLEVKWYRAWV